MSKLKLAIDVGYHETGATSAGVLFETWTDAKPFEEYQAHIEAPEPYVPGEFYKRELPCITRLLQDIEHKVETIIVDGFVWLSSDEQPKPGLGAILFQHLNEKIPVIGVAKKEFAGSKATQLLRGKSVRPLFITSAGIDIVEAIHYINKMHGAHRIPTLLKRVDTLSREVLDAT